MKITVLGAGIGASDYKTGTNRYPPAFLVTWGSNGKLLLECSLAVQQRLEEMGYDYADIHHIAISHPHPDHCAPIHFIQSVFIKGIILPDQFQNPSMTFYGPDYLIDNFMTLWNIYCPDRKNEVFARLNVALEAMSKGDKTIKIDDATLTSAKVYHAFGKCDAVGYRLETPQGVLAYSGDTGDCEGVRKIAKDADIFICEASAKIGDFAAPKEYGHLNPYTVGEIAKAANVKKIILFHYFGIDSDTAMIEDVKKSGFLGEVIAGKDLTVINS